MATRMILKNGDPQLRKHCHEVKDFNPRLHTLSDFKSIVQFVQIDVPFPVIGANLYRFCLDAVRIRECFHV